MNSPTNKPTLNELLTDWTEAATVRVKSKGPGHLPSRKVPTTGSAHVKLTRAQVYNILRSVARGEETFIDYEGESIIRIYPHLDADSGMISLAETLGNFRNKMFTGLRLKLTSPKGKREISREEYDYRMAKVRSSRRDHVTPETLVRCPRCGKEFKVGKSLA